MKTASVALLLALVASAAAAQQLYRWTDEKGRVHVTDTPPPGNARDVKREAAVAPSASTQQLPFELETATKSFPVVLYTAPNCLEECANARAALNKRGVPFREVQVWDADTHAELKKASGSNEVPVLMVGRSVQKGFEQGAFDALLDSARYPRAGLLQPRNQAAPKPPEGYVSPAARDAALRAQPVKPEEPAPRGRYAPKAPAKPQAEPPKVYAPIPGKDTPVAGPYGKPAADPQAAEPQPQQQQ